MSSSLRRWVMTEPGAPLRPVDSDLPSPGPGQALVRVAGCGVCHTDLGFYYEGVRTRAPMPLALGHEVAGRIVAVGEGVDAPLNSAVVVPAVLPCGSCPTCLAGDGTMCPTQFMPGNDGHGGFATHMLVPALGLCPVPMPDDAADDAPINADTTLRQLSVLADAASTSYQAVLRSGLQPGGTAIVVGAGGVGIYAVQLAKALGARVVAIDVDDARLASATALGADLVLNSTDDGRALRKAVKAFHAESTIAAGVRVFECSGHPAGQELAFGILGPAGVLMVVGYTTAKVTIRLSRLMALDATARGNWGCLPRHYPELLQMVLDGRIAVAPLVREFPLSQVQEVLEAVKAHAITERPVLVPDLQGDRQP